MAQTLCVRDMGRGQKYCCRPCWGSFCPWDQCFSSFLLSIGVTISCSGTFPILSLSWEAPYLKPLRASFVSSIQPCAVTFEMFWGPGEKLSRIHLVSRRWRESSKTLSDREMEMVRLLTWRACRKYLVCSGNTSWQILPCIPRGSLLGSPTHLSTLTPVTHAPSFYCWPQTGAHPPPFPILGSPFHSSHPSLLHPTCGAMICGKYSHSYQLSRMSWSSKTFTGEPQRQK